MEYKTKMSMELHCVVFVVVLLAKLGTVYCYNWPQEWRPNSQFAIEESDGRIEVFEGKTRESDHFKLLLADEHSMLIGARNAVHNVSLDDLQEQSRIDWSSNKADVDLCKKKQKTAEQCQNYIRVLVKKNNKRLYVCGTNAFRPRCRTYEQHKNEYIQRRDQDGVAKCPYDPEQKSTAIYAGEKLYSGTVADISGRDPLIIESKSMLRTPQYKSEWLNEPNFVSSFDKDDKIYFFFRETAVEHINCGKAVFSRVARVCKSDSGGGRSMDETWTSFFKARLNCSIPGSYPFYFDEIQSTSDFGQGNFRPTMLSYERSDMVYAVFTTPENSIHGSAVCAFKYSDIVSTFEGRFKGQESVRHNWLFVPKMKTPSPHPQKCNNNTRVLSDTTLNFIKSHPLMDKAVPASGGAPLLIQTSFKSRFTQIAVDWQVHGSDMYYDVMFVGTDDGRVIKAINKAGLDREDKNAIETVIIEDIQVFKDKQAVVNLKVYREGGIEKLVAISKDKILSIPLHRCNEKKTCQACIRLQDPYCSWADDMCSNTDRGFQSIETGVHDSCGLDITEEVPQEKTTTPATVEKEKCVCPTTPMQDAEKDKTPTLKMGPRLDEQLENTQSVGNAETLAIAVVVSIVLSMLVGFLIGYKVSACRASRDIESPTYQERSISLSSKKSNRLSSGDHTYFNPDSPYKGFSYVVNVKTPGKLNSGVETKPVTKSNKVYL